MNRKSLCLVLAILISSSSFAYTDSLWIVEAEGYAGDLVTVEVWLQYEGSGGTDSIGAFDIALTWDASVCTVEAITIGQDFAEAHWTHYTTVDNAGTNGPPLIPKIALSAYYCNPPVGCPCVERGTHLAATIDVRILSSAVRGDSACFDTLMRAFDPPVYLGFVDDSGIHTYIPSFSTDCIRVLSYTDSLWIVGGEGYPGDLVSAEVWLQYEGGGYGDSMTCFDVPLTFDATVCTVEAIELGPDFCDWQDWIGIDNQGTQGPPAIPKMGISAFTLYPLWGPPGVPRGTYLAGKVKFRILDTVLPPDSTCPDTLARAFTPQIFLGFMGVAGDSTYHPSFSTDCIRATEYHCGDTNADGRITSADIVYMGNYIYRHGPDPYGQADVNLDQRITIADAIYLGNYIYRNGPEPCNPP
jgi:hypothetical protein